MWDEQKFLNWTEFTGKNLSSLGHSAFYKSKSAKRPPTHQHQKKKKSCSYSDSHRRRFRTWPCWNNWTLYGNTFVICFENIDQRTWMKKGACASDFAGVAASKWGIRWVTLKIKKIKIKKNLKYARIVNPVNWRDSHWEWNLSESLWVLQKGPG